MADYGTQPAAPEARPAGAPPLVGQWSWAGFMMNWLYLIGHNVVGLGVALVIIGVVLSIIPFVNFISPLYWLAIALFVGVKGHEYAWNSGTFKTVDEFMAAQRVLNTMGKVWFFIMVVVVIIWLILLIIFGPRMMAMFGGLAGAGAPSM